MLKKHVSWLAMLCLALAALLPSASSALTLAELTGTVATSNYTPVTITSATNKTITITATPLSYSSNQWLYQVSWNRAKNAKGSLYVSLKSNNGTKVATVATADQAGSTTFTALPSTAYRVEFYSQPNGKGSLLVRKYFTALAGQNVSSVSNAGGYSYNGSSASTPAASAAGNSVSSGSSTSGWSLGLNGLGYTSGNPTRIEKSGKLVGPPIDTGSTNPCDQALFAKSSYGPNTPRNADDPSTTFSCNHIGQNVVTQLAYQGSDNNCYFADLAGTYQIACVPGLPKLNATTSLSYSQIPKVTDPSFNWYAASARCFYTQGDTANNGAIYGGSWETICGAGSNGSSFPPSPSQFCSVYPNDSSCKGLGTTPSTTNPGTTNPGTATSPSVTPPPSSGTGTFVNGFALGLPGAGYQAAFTSQIEKSGKLVGPAIDTGPTSQCDQSLFAKSSYGPNTPRNPDDPSASFSCSHIGQNVVTQLAYQGSDNNCYFADLHGTYQIACVPGLPKLNATTSLSYSQIPSVTDSTFNWYAAGARCIYTQGDIGNNGAIYGGSWDAICGAAPHGTSMPPTPSQFCFLYPNDSSCKSGAANPAAVTNQTVPGLAGVGYNAVFTTQIEKIGKLVGPAIDTGPTNPCDQNLFAQSSYGPSNPRNPDDPSASFSCNHIGQNVVTQLAYQGSDNNCYFADLHGTYQIPCVQGLPKFNATTSLSYSQIPSVTDPTFNWGAASAQCYYTQGDTANNGAIYGGSWGSICGAAPHGKSLPPTPSQFCSVYPNDQTCQGISSSNSNINTMASSPASSTAPSKGSGGSTCQSNGDCNSGLCFGMTPNNRIGTCGY